MTDDGKPLVKYDSPLLPTDTSADSGGNHKAAVDRKVSNIMKLSENAAKPSIYTLPTESELSTKEPYDDYYKKATLRIGKS